MNSAHRGRTDVHAPFIAVEEMSVQVFPPLSLDSTRPGRNSCRDARPYLPPLASSTGSGCVCPFLAAVLLLPGCADGKRVNVVNTNDDGKAGIAAKNQQVTGGPCQYRDYPGAVNVKEVRASAGGDEMVTVEFDADASGAAPQPARHFSRDMTLSREQAARMGVAAGKKYRASASYITQGTCDPGPYLARPDEWQ